MLSIIQAGMTKDLQSRFYEHKRGEVKSTSWRLPVELVFYSAFATKKQAAKFEKYLKSHSGRRFRNRFLLEDITR